MFTNSAVSLLQNPMSLHGVDLVVEAALQSHLQHDELAVYLLVHKTYKVILVVYCAGRVELRHRYTKLWIFYRSTAIMIYAYLEVHVCIYIFTSAMFSLLTYVLS